MRAAVVTASAPHRARADVRQTRSVTSPNITCTCPPTRSVTAGAEPRYGTWTRSTPVIALNSSPARCGVVPLPEEAMLILPGLALA